MKGSQVKVYSTPTCPWCHRTKKFLDDNHIPYQDLNVAEDRKARDDMVHKSGQLAVPVVDIDGEIRIGWDQAWLKQKLGL